MSNSNGLTSTPGLFFSGNVNSNVYIRNPEPELINPIVNSNIQFQSDVGEVGEIGFDSVFGITGRMGIVAQNSILLVPNSQSGNTNGGMLIQDGVESPVLTGIETYKVAPSLPNNIIKYDNGQRFFQVLSGTSITVNSTFIGRSTFTNQVPAVNLPGAGSVPNGAEVIIYVQPLNTTLFKNSVGTTILSVTTTATQLAQVTCFTGNQGAQWFISSVLYVTA